MRSLIFLAIFLSLAMVSVEAQEILSVDISDFIEPLAENLHKFGIIPRLDSFTSESSRAFFIILILMWLVFSVAIGLGDLPSAVFSFFLSSWLYNNIPSLFVPSSAQGLFSYVFSALFIFIWVDYIFKYLWSVSRTTKLFLEASITMIAVMFMEFSNIYAMIADWIGIVLSVFGFIAFILFLTVMKVFNAYFSLMNIRAADDTRKAGKEAAIEAEKKATTTLRGAGGNE